ncbi:hypothetical protein GY45DRAFT_1257909 [Cubamyces sp. BRFM 1775]|nr:hypothetical protein GY45DRAFT_1257909 [Cubamyces sp. BRFM 1775]
MDLLQCYSCSASFSSAIGLGQHNRKCPARSANITENLKKRRIALGETDEDCKRQRTEDEPNADRVQVCSDVPTAPSPLVPLSRSGRHIRVPRIWKDYEPSCREALPKQLCQAFPEARSPSPHATTTPPPPPPPEAVPEVNHSGQVFDTQPNSFGVFNRYVDIPQQQPAPPSSVPAAYDIPEAVTTPQVDPELYPSIRWINRKEAHLVPSAPYGPFPSKTVYLLCEWFYNSANTKSLDDLDDLVETLKTSGFDIADLQGFRAQREMQRLDTYVNPSGTFSQADGWQEGSVDLPLPKTGVCFKREEDAPTFTIEGLYFRKILEVIVSEVQDQHFAGERHWIPHKTFWNPYESGSSSTEGPSPPTSSPSSEPSAGAPDPVRLFSETYNSDAMNEAYSKLREQPRHPDDSDSIEYAILPCLLWSDATLLALFGSAKLWPIYLYIGNISKYVRGMPTEFVAQHLAYIPELPDDLLDFYREQYGTTPSAETLRWLRCELMQRIWSHLLDDDFIHAYTHGILVECADGVIRRLFPRFFTYSADYPEKVLITALKNLGKCPCPRCLIKKDQISATGTSRDDRRRALKRVDTPARRADIKRARKWLFTRGYSITSKHIRDLLDERSMLPLQLFAPDLLHEFELGVWKGTFLHLMRLLHAQGRDVVQEYDRRMRKMPTFGRDIIRRFWKNTSSRSRLAARDFEDFLITSMPAFEGLLPSEDNCTIQDLLFELLNWHALAHLRLHTSVTLLIWRAAVRHMYGAFRVFARTTCTCHVAHELPQEAEAKVRRRAKQRTRRTTTRISRDPSGPKVVAFNVWNTYKYHALADHPDYVERSGTTDNFSTQVGELEHRHCKGVFARTNKHQFEKQIANHQRRRALLRAVRATAQKEHRHLGEKIARRTTRNSAPRPSHTRDLPPRSDPSCRYDVGESQRDPLDIYDWVADHDGDPAVEVHEWTDNLSIKDDRLYTHNVINFNYPTYDMRRAQDSVNPKTHADIMVLADDHSDEHPYWYARVIGVYHAQVRYTGPRCKDREWHRLDILRVRWFLRDKTSLCGFQHRRLPRLSFVDLEHPTATAFGFIDPASVLRAAYIMPAFHFGTTSDLLPPDSIGRLVGDEDYVYYYACMFVDRDTYMRYLGGGVGHKGLGVSLDTSLDHARRAVRQHVRHRRTESEHGSRSDSNTSQSTTGDISEDDACTGIVDEELSRTPSPASVGSNPASGHDSNGEDVWEDWGPCDDLLPWEYHLAHAGESSDDGQRSDGSGGAEGSDVESSSEGPGDDPPTLRPDLFESYVDENHDLDAEFPRL